MSAPSRSFQEVLTHQSDLSSKEHSFTPSTIGRRSHQELQSSILKASVVNCFRHCGMQATVTEPAKDPFADIDEYDAQLEDQVNHIHPDDCMTASKYAEADNEVATCATLESCENWRLEWLEMVVSNGHQSKRVDVEDENGDADEETEGPPASAITTYTEARKLGNDMLTFFQSREEEVADSMFTIIHGIL